MVTQNVCHQPRHSQSQMVTFEIGCSSLMELALGGEQSNWEGCQGVTNLFLPDSASLRQTRETH